MTTADRELLRRTLIRILCASRDVQFSVPVLIDRLAERVPDRSWDEVDVQEALAFLEGMYLCRRVISKFQGPPKWEVTQEGVNFHARNG